MASVVSLSKIRKDYQRGRETVKVLFNFDLEIVPSDFVAIMGPSGSGKTTLLNLVGGLDRPTSGIISVAGQPISAYSESELARWRARHVGFVFQLYNLLTMLSAEQNVELPLLLSTLDARQRKRKVAIALELVGLSDRARFKPLELSGGQQQRVAIARALVTDPTLLICDEPTGDLDRCTADEILGLLRTLSRQDGKTIIMVTHDPKAAAFAARTLYIDKGQLLDQALGTVM